MSAVLLDTSVLIRLANTRDREYPTALNAVDKLHRLGETLHITPQVLVEFRAVATRPQSANGLGLSLGVAERQAAEFEAVFPLLPETPAVYPAWKAVVAALGVVGKQVHDARLAAVCHVHGVPRILTFNLGHFARLAAAPPGLAALDPAAA